MNKLLIIVIFCIFLQNCASKNKGDEIAKKPLEPVNMRDKILERKSNGIFSSKMGSSGGGNYEFATSNILWRAALESFEEMPILSANYSGGLLITDWIGSGNNRESYKIQVTFKSSELSTSSIEIKTFLKKCSENLNSCKVSKGSEKTNREIKNNILQKARALEIKKSKKNN